MGKNLNDLVDEWNWNGSFFPEERCFAALASDVPSVWHEELKALIKARAKKHNSSLEC